MALSIVVICYLNHQMERYYTEDSVKKGNGVQSDSLMIYLGCLEWCKIPDKLLSGETLEIAFEMVIQH